MEIGGSSKALDVSARTPDLVYMQASNVNVSNFVSVKLSGRSNYKIWKAQMICLVKSQVLFHIIDTENRFPGSTSHGNDMNAQYDQLVKGWIFGTMSDHVLNNFADFSSARQVWMELEFRFGKPIPKGAKGDLSSALDVSARTEDLRYMLALTVNASDFVSLKLSGHSNYDVWKTQMLCLIESHDFLHIILAEEIRMLGEGDLMTQKYDKLVRGWILSTMNDQLLNDFKYYSSVQLLWRELESKFTNPPETSYAEDDISAGFVFRTESVRDPNIRETDNIRLKRELSEAAIEGCWGKAKSILKNHRGAATEAINENGDTILHIAVEMRENNFLEKLLNFLEDGNDIEKQNSKGQTALHIASVVGNKYAAQVLVQKRKELSVILDNNGESPLDISYANMMVDISAYLLKFTLTSDLSSYPPLSQENAIFSAILTKQYDLAEKLLLKFPEIASQNYLILKAITITFPTELGFTESIIYPSLDNVRQKIVTRGFMLIDCISCDKSINDILQAIKFLTNPCNGKLGKLLFKIFGGVLYHIYILICLLILVLRLPFSTLYFRMWKDYAYHVHPLKSIEKRKKNYIEAKKVLRLICAQMGSSHGGYSESIIEAVRQGTYEVVDEILFTSPKTINCKDEEGHNIVQLTVINRSEKVYNLICHIIEYYRRTKDSSMNNLAHLAGRLAPSLVLSRTMGAALQLQRELIWRQEVEKLMLPLELRERNNYMETPAMMFTREHQDLLKQGEQWMKTTAKSCSITTGLIVTIVFAAAITVPGGSNQDSGIPIFRKETAFTVFAVSNAFSLFTATTALLLFLSILTTRFSERDFLARLPRRMIFGLLTLFLSTTAMIVAFCAILFLVFCDQRPWMLVPICGFACLPILVIATIKLPLLVDFIQSTYIPIFGKQSYLESCKINQKKTIFFHYRNKGDLEDQLLC